MTFRNYHMAWFRRNLDTVEQSSEIQIVGTYLGRKVRISDFDLWLKKYPFDKNIVGDRSGIVLQIGEKDFDRWANSVAAEVFLENLPTKDQLWWAISKVDANE